MKTIHYEVRFTVTMDDEVKAWTLDPHALRCEVSRLLSQSAHPLRHFMVSPVDTRMVPAPPEAGPPTPESTELLQWLAERPKFQIVRVDDTWAVVDCTTSPSITIADGATPLLALRRARGRALKATK